MMVLGIHWICNKCQQPNDIRTRKTCIECGKRKSKKDKTTQELGINILRKGKGWID